MRQNRRTSRSAVAAAYPAIVVACMAGCGGGATSPGANGVATIQVSPDSASVVTGSSQTFVAHAHAASGATIPGPTFFWSTSDSLVATVNQSGVVTAHQPGAAQVGASAQ